MTISYKKLKEENKILHEGDLFVDYNDKVYRCDEKYVNCKVEDWDFQCSPLHYEEHDWYVINAKQVKKLITKEDYPEYFI